MLELSAATKTFAQGRHPVAALKGVDLSIGRGEFASIMGPSGSGKTTVLSILGCLDTPTTGAYRLNGRDVVGLSVRRRARIRNSHFGFVFQNYNLLPRATAVENVALPLLYRGETAQQRNRRAIEVLRMLGLGERLGHRPVELSGGEQQRVALARAIASRPDVLFADEPTGALDSRTGASIMNALGQLNDAGLTVVLVTHDAEVARYSGRIIRLLDGRVAAQDLTDRGGEKP